MALRTVNERPAGFETRHRPSQRLRRRSRTIKNRKTTIGGHTPERVRLGKFRRKINEIVKLAFNLKGQQPSPDNQLFGDGVVGSFTTEQANEMPDNYRINKQGKEQQPAPKRQDTIWPLAKNLM